MTTRIPQPSQSRVCVCVCVCRKPNCLHILDIVVFCIATNSFATNHYSLRHKLSRSSRHCIHSRRCLRFLACSCVLCLYWSLSWVTWRTFHSDTRPQIIQSFRFHKENYTWFCHLSSRAMPGTPASLQKEVFLCSSALNLIFSRYLCQTMQQ